MPTARESVDSKYSMCDPKVNLLSIISPRYSAALTTSIGVELMATVMLLVGPAKVNKVKIFSGLCYMIKCVLTFVSGV